MKYIHLLCMSLCFWVCSCHNQSSLPDITGTYENTEDDSLTKIERINDTEYLIDVADAKDRIAATRNGNTLSGKFQGLQISAVFNATGDTLTGMENGKILFQSVKINR